MKEKVQFNDEKDISSSNRKAIQGCS